MSFSIENVMVVLSGVTNGRKWGYTYTFGSTHRTVTLSVKSLTIVRFGALIRSDWENKSTIIRLLQRSVIEHGVSRTQVSTYIVLDDIYDEKTVRFSHMHPFYRAHIF